MNAIGQTLMRIAQELLQRPDRFFAVIQAFAKGSNNGSGYGDYEMESSGNESPSLVTTFSLVRMALLLVSTSYGFVNGSWSQACRAFETLRKFRMRHKNAGRTAENTWIADLWDSVSTHQATWVIQRT